MLNASPRRAYPTDLTDEQWALVEPWLSERAWTGRPRTLDLREVVNAVLYLLRTGCQWRYLPHEFPHWCSVRYYYDLWLLNGTWERINAALCAADRERVGRDAQPSAGVIDSQTAKTTESGGERGFDRGSHALPHGFCTRNHASFWCKTRDHIYILWSQLLANPTGCVPAKPPGPFAPETTLESASG